MTATVVTAVYGGFDQLRPQVEQDVDTEWLCFTDDPHLPAPEPWQVVVERRHHADPRMCAKVRKMVPPALTPDVVWIDGSHEVTSPSFVRRALLARHQGLAAFKHPRRSCIYTEAEASVGVESQGGKYDDQPIREQVARYRAMGHPEGWGLWACGVLAWDMSDPRARSLGRLWLAECERWSVQDQISLPVVARRMNVTPGTFPVPQLELRGAGWIGNRWVHIWPHRAEARA